MPYLLDADSASLAINGNKRLRDRIRNTPGVWLSAIAAEEITRGAIALINQSRDKAGSPAAYILFANLLSSYCDYSIQPYNTEAMLVYASFSAQVKRVGTQDCRIAASAIAAGWIVVTANQKHFSQIPVFRLKIGHRRLFNFSYSRRHDT